MTDPFNISDETIRACEPEPPKPERKPMPDDVKAEFAGLSDLDAVRMAVGGVLLVAAAKQDGRIEVITKILSEALVEDLGFHR